MVTLQNIFMSVLKDGYEGHREPLEIAFGMNREELGVIKNGSLRYVDGMARGLSVLGCLHYVLTALDGDILTQAGPLLACCVLCSPGSGGFGLLDTFLASGTT